METDLSRDAAGMRRIFVSLGLAQADEPVHAQPLAGGVSSGIYRVDLRSGSYCVKQALPQLKVAKEWKVPVERVFQEIGYLQVVAGIAPAQVPRVLGQDDTSKSFVMPFLGEGFRNWKAELLAERVDPAVAGALGDLVGRIHAATADDATLAARFATDEHFHAIRLEPYLVEAARVQPEVAAPLLDLVRRTAATRRVLVHGDVSPKNVLLGPQGPVLLDAECAWFGDPAFDAAFCLNHFLLKAAHLPRRADAFMACAREFSAGYARHAAWEPWAALEVRIATLLPGLALARVDGKSPVEYLGAAQREAVRATALRLLKAQPATLDALRQAWMEAFAP